MPRPPSPKPKLTPSEEETLRQSEESQKAYKELGYTGKRLPNGAFDIPSANQMDAYKKRKQHESKKTALLVRQLLENTPNSVAPAPGAPNPHAAHDNVATLRTLDEFTKAYIDCMLWTEEDSLQEDADKHEDEYEGAGRWDVNIFVLAPEAVASIKEDCTGFQEGHAELLEQAAQIRDDYGPTQAGHDFWLSRNGHGAGFFDSGLGRVGTQLQSEAKVYGSSYLYFGDDGKLYLQ